MNTEVQTLIGNEVAHTGPSLTQVYQVTHKDGQYLPFMNRSFISFSYGGKNIEDFNLIAYFSSDRLEKEAYAPFNDLVSSYDVINGQFYWGTYYTANSLQLTLTTDAITQYQLDDFKHWFRAGEIKELILAEHPNRAIMARVAQPPHLKLLPFEKPLTIELGSGGQAGTNEAEIVREYTTSTTEYRGDIEIEFVMDEPFWYSKKNLLGIQDTVEGYYKEGWINANNVEVSVRESKDALKIVYEDRIPLGSTTQISVFLGGDTYATVRYEACSIIEDYPITQQAYIDVVNYEYGTIQTKTSYYKVNEDTEEVILAYNDNTPNDTSVNWQYRRGAVISNGTKDWGGCIGGATLTGTEEGAQGIPLGPNESAHLYYAGTAPAPVKIRFTLLPLFTHYILSSPSNKYNNPDKPYSTITLKATKEHKFEFSIPSLYASYNQILKILDDNNIMREGNAWLIVRETVRDTIRDPYVRAWANKIFDFYDDTGSNIISSSNISAIGEIKRAMMYLFIDEEGDGAQAANEQVTGSITGMPATFIFDGKTGNSIGKFKIRNPFKSNLNLVPNGQDNPVQILQKSEYITANDYFIEIEENVGDMVKSSYLVLDERNVLGPKMQVQAWQNDHPDYSYLITHDLPNNLEDLHFEFKNMYL